MLTFTTHSPCCPCVSVCAASNMHLCGFRGATFVGAPFDLHKVPVNCQLVPMHAVHPFCSLPLPPAPSNSFPSSYLPILLLLPISFSPFLPSFLHFFSTKKNPLYSLSYTLISFPSSLPSHCPSSILLDPSPQAPIAYPYDCSHIAMTYTALASLLILGDDLSRVNRPGVFRGMRELQLDSGR